LRRSAYPFLAMSSADAVEEEGNGFVVVPPVENEVEGGDLNGGNGELSEEIPEKKEIDEEETTEGGGNKEDVKETLVENVDRQMARLHEQIRSLATKVASQDKEINVLKQRLSDPLDVSEHTFQFDGTVGESLLTEKFKSEPFEMSGVNVVLCGENSLDSEGEKEIVVWYELQSNSPDVVTLLSQIDVRGDCGTNFIRTSSSSEFIRLGSSFAVAGERHFVAKWQSEFLDKMWNYHLTFLASVKIMKATKQNSIDPNVEQRTTVALGDETVHVIVPYIAEWSEYFRAFFALTMQGVKEDFITIENCTTEDFREMLDVIYPTSKPIDIWNVEKMLHMADRFIMPMLTHKCEVFLNESSKHNFSEIKLLQLADKFDLYYTKNVVLEKIPTFADLRSKVIKAEGYGSLSSEMKQAIDTRYVKLHVQEMDKE
ncbi:hypothetical protein PFISCL1PPCAC_24444, partial [Pristionchus fissidentatus]